MPLHERTLESLAHLFLPMLSDVETWARYEFVSIFNKLCVRLKCVVLQAKKALELEMEDSARNDYSSQELWHTQEKLSQSESAHVRFSVNLLDSFLLELGPSSSYQRHIVALMCLETAVSCGLANEIHPQFFTSCNAGIFLDLLMDGYGDVRSSAARILMLFPKDCSLIVRHPRPDAYRSEGVDIYRRAEDLTKDTGRASIADGLGQLNQLSIDHSFAHGEPADTCGARLEGLVRSLETDINSAESNLAAAVASAPLHARFISLRLVICRPEFLQMCFGSNDDLKRHLSMLDQRIIGSCSRTWDIVKSVLCIDSPEGQHEQAEELFDDDALDIGPKDTLSYCWRSLKESSALLATMLACEGHYTGFKEEALSSAQLISIGVLCLTQLSELRHRGAFSTVASTFLECCSKCVRSTNSVNATMPIVWFQEHVKPCIVEKAKSLTRRSAGIPSMAAAILAALPPGKSFDGLISWLQETARHFSDDQVELPQVHALNCLKDIISNSRLGEKTEPYLEETLEISVDCLFHHVWAIRNCGIMLFKALLTRLLKGSSMSQESGIEDRRRFAAATQKRYPKLIDIAVRLLQASVTDTAGGGSDDTARRIQTAFPALEIIEAIGVPANHLTLVQNLLFQQLGNRSWNLRDKAGRALGILITPSKLLQLLQGASQDSTMTQNREHGILLCLKYLCSCHDFKVQECDCVIASLRLLCSSALLRQCNVFTQAARWEVCSALLEHKARYREPSRDEPLMKALDCVFVALEQIPPRDQVVIDAMARAHMKTACLQSTLANTSTPVYQALQKFVSKEYYAPKTAMRTVQKPPRIGSPAEFLSFVEIIHKLIMSETPDVAAAAADFLVELISSFHNGPVREQMELDRYPPDFFDMIHDLLRLPFMRGLSDPVSYISAIRCRGSLISMVDHHCQTRSWGGHTLGVWTEKWAKMLQQALDHRSVSPLFFRGLQCFESMVSWTGTALSE